MQHPPSRLGTLLKVSILVIALFGVLYGIRKLNTQGLGPGAKTLLAIPENESPERKARVVIPGKVDAGGNPGSVSGSKPSQNP